MSVTNFQHLARPSTGGAHSPDFFLSPGYWQRWGKYFFQFPSRVARMLRFALNSLENVRSQSLSLIIYLLSHRTCKTYTMVSAALFWRAPAARKFEISILKIAISDELFHHGWNPYWSQEKSFRLCRLCRLTRYRRPPYHISIFWRFEQSLLYKEWILCLDRSFSVNQS